jgi:holo-[acyl-carrier protein] synthase
MLTVGVDILELWRLKGVLERWGPSFLDRIYTPDEQAYCRGRIPQLAARFAAKEAVMKALGTGTRGVGWRDIEVTRKRGQAPQIALHDRALARAARIGMTQVAISLSHSRDYAVASVVMTVDENSNL